MAGTEGIIRLHPYQRRAVAAVNRAWENHQSMLVVLPTGTGKTIVFSSLLGDRRTKGRCMVLAHRDELIRQAVAKIRVVTGITPDVEKAGEWADTQPMFRSPIIVSSIQTQVSGRSGSGRMTRFRPCDFSTLVCDEAHHATSPTWRRTINHYRANPELRIVGVTATPNRHDEAALGQVFGGGEPFVYDLLDAIRDGWLCPVKSYTMPIDSLDISGINTCSGDLSAGRTGEEMSRDKPLMAIADAIWRESDGRKTLVYTPSVEHARRLCGVFNTDFASGSARTLSGKTPLDARRATLAAYAVKDFPIMVVCQLLGEGFDDPGIEVVVPRPTISTPAYLQMIGRATRTLPGVLDSREWDDDQLELGIEGEANCSALRRKLIAESSKPWCEILDLHCQSGRHRLVTASDVLGGKYDDVVVDRARQTAARDGKAIDPAERLKQAEDDIRRETALRLARGKMNYRARYSKTETDPFSVFAIAAPRQYGWDKRRAPSEKQLAMLRKCRVPTEGLSHSEASAIIGEIIERRNNQLPSYRQAYLLRRAGFRADMPMKIAKPILDTLAANGWRWPAHVARPDVETAKVAPEVAEKNVPADIVAEFGAPV